MCHIFLLIKIIIKCFPKMNDKYYFYVFSDHYINKGMDMHMTIVGQTQGGGISVQQDYNPTSDQSTVAILTPPPTRPCPPHPSGLIDPHIGDTPPAVLGSGKSPVMFQPELCRSIMWRRRSRRWSKRWSLGAVAESSPLATIRGRLGLHSRALEGLCVSSLQGALRWHTWLMEEQQQDMTLQQHQPDHFLSVSVHPADGEDLDIDLDQDPALPDLDLQLCHFGRGRRSLRPLMSSLAEHLSPKFPNIT